MVLIRINVLVLTSLHLWCRYTLLHLHLLLLLLLRCRLISCVLLQLHLISHLIFCRHSLVLCLLLRRERTPPLPKDPPHINKLNPRELLHDDRSHLIGKEYISSGGSFRCVGVFSATFSTAFGRLAFYNVSTCVMSRRRNVLRDLLVISLFVFFGPLDPGCLLLGCEILIHTGGVLSKLTKCHTRVLLFEAIAHSVLIKEVSRYISFGSVNVFLHLTISPSRRLDSSILRIGNE